MKKINIIYTLAFMQVLVYSTTFAQNVEPVKGEGGKYSFGFANLYFEVDASKGGRICSFQLDKKEILYNSANMLQSGSTFWPSPQSVWNWPPNAVLDRRSYASTILKNELVLTSDTSSLHLQFIKIFSANSKDSSISIKYVMKNTSTTAISWAPWEITRVKASGITFFEKGEGSVTGDMVSNTNEISGIVWYDQNTSTNSMSIKKFFCDGKGWLAHVTTDNILFIKNFTDIPLAKAAPAESEIEVYTEPSKLYTELENQGAYVTLNPKDSISWQVKWYARKLPEKTSVKAGSNELVALTNKIINGNHKMKRSSSKK